MGSGERKIPIIFMSKGQSTTKQSSVFIFVDNIYRDNFSFLPVIQEWVLSFKYAMSCFLFIFKIKIEGQGQWRENSQDALLCGTLVKYLMYRYCIVCECN